MPEPFYAMSRKGDHNIYIWHILVGCLSHGKLPRVFYRGKDGGRPGALMGPPGPSGAGPLWAPLSPCGPGPDRPPLALVGRPLVAPPGPLWAKPF